MAAVASFNEGGEISDLVTPRSAWDGAAFEASAVEQFVRNRHSVRNFDMHRSVDAGVIADVVSLAGTTPSVCNRRSYRAHFYDDPEAIAGLLSLQNGNAGFGHTVPALIVVTERRSAFVGAGERNQRWVDGGLFAMSLVWLLHAFGLGSCFLNWSQPNSQTRRLRAIGRIPETEDVIVLIAIGYPAEGHRVARSPERSLSDLLERH